MNNKKLRCIHRHTIEEHPSCFARGLVKYKNEKDFIKSTGRNWYEFPGYRIGYLDIEASGLHSDIAVMLSWCIKERGGDVKYQVISKEDLFNNTLDKNLISGIIEEMNKYDILVGYYSTKYDIPFIRGRALFHGLSFPQYGSIYHFDLYYRVKSLLNLNTNSLRNVTDFLGIEGKTNLKQSVWMKAMYGDKDALNEVLLHNIKDVEILEELHNVLYSFSKWTRKYI